MQIAGLYFLHCNTYHIAPKPTQLEIAEYPENALFRRLESMQPREKPLQLEPGQILLAVYGDNWWVQLLLLTHISWAYPSCFCQHAGITVQQDQIAGNFGSRLP